MGIQDKIFDVAAALEGQDEKNDFDKIIEYLGNLEYQLTQLRQFKKTVIDYQRLLKSIK